MNEKEEDNYINKLLTSLELFETKTGLVSHLLEISYIYKHKPQKVAKDFLMIYNELGGKIV